MRTEDKTMEAVSNHSYTSYLALSFLPAHRTTWLSLAGESIQGLGRQGAGSEPRLCCCCELLWGRRLACELLCQHLHLEMLL